MLRTIWLFDHVDRHDLSISQDVAYRSEKVCAAPFVGARFDYEVGPSFADDLLEYPEVKGAFGGMNPKPVGGSPGGRVVVVQIREL